jgi:cytochrome P450
MIAKKKDRGHDERLDRLGREIVRASATNEREAEESATSPFLYTRLRSRIAEERARREEGESWLSMLAVAWRTVPAMALAAIFALILFLSAGTDTTRAPDNFSDEALLDTRDAGVEQVVFADRQTLSSDEVLTTILDADEQGASR